MRAKQSLLLRFGHAVYNYAHIGNLRTYIFEDILKRTLLYNKFEVKHVMNITDVGHLVSDDDYGEDKMEKGAKREGKSCWEIAAFYTKTFKNDLERLNILAPNVWCKATDHIREQLRLIEILEKKGYTYRIGDGIYFDTSKLTDYGKLTRQDLTKLKKGARVEVVEGKKNATDFALWKFSPINKKRQMEWDSKYGVGFPGWHVECSAMSMKYLGDRFDIHCGGIDLIPIHHTNEIAQSEAAGGKKFVNYWLHGEFVIMEKNKMAKSSNNFITLQGLIDKNYSALDFRYLCLNTHYRKPLMFSWKGLDSAKNSLFNLKEKIKEIKHDKLLNNKTKIRNYKVRFIKEINDDLNVTKALATLWVLVKDNKVGREKLKIIRDFDRIFGLDLVVSKEEKIPAEILELAAKRERFRMKKDYKKADEIRKIINEKGYSINDKSSGYEIIKK